MEVPRACAPARGRKKGKKKKKKKERKKKKKRKKRRSLGKGNMQRGWRASVCGVQGPEGYILMKGKVDTK